MNIFLRGQIKPLNPKPAPCQPHLSSYSEALKSGMAGVEDTPLYPVKSLQSQITDARYLSEKII
jgi:hypothetical protein